jgi:hypothetical protein
MGLFGSILGALIPPLGAAQNAKAVKKAGKAQQQAMQAGIDEQRREYDTSRADFQPFMQFGSGALGPLGDLLGLNGNDKASAAIANLKASPLFTSLFNTGAEATLQDASATGGLRGGNTEGALYDLGQRTLAQVIQQQIANLFGAQGVGSGATSTVAGLGANMANNISALDTGIGQAKAGSILGQQNVWNQFAKQLQQAVMMAAGGGGGIPSPNIGASMGFSGGFDPSSIIPAASLPGGF